MSALEEIFNAAAASDAGTDTRREDGFMAIWNAACDAQIAQIAYQCTGLGEWLIDAIQTSPRAKPKE